VTKPVRGLEEGGDRADPRSLAGGRRARTPLAPARAAAGEALADRDAGRTVVRYLPPWRIELTVRPGVPRLLSLDAIARLAAAALDSAAAPSPASLGIILADDRELAVLNLRVMGKSGPTDVLSFPLLPPDAFPAHGRHVARTPALFPLPPRVRPHLGDIVVSVERAVEQARAGHGGQTGDVAWEPADELALLLVHGVLHVCGWDHAAAADEAAMRALERRILAAHGPGARGPAVRPVAGPRRRRTR
jgi:probable rRNA maturation factor